MSNSLLKVQEANYNTARIVPISGVLFAKVLSRFFEPCGGSKLCAPISAARPTFTGIKWVGLTELGLAQK